PLAHNQFRLYVPRFASSGHSFAPSTLPARRISIKGLQTNYNAGASAPVLSTIDLPDHEGVSGITPIFFPASPFTLEHSLLFAKQRDYVNVSDQFRPGTPSGTQRHFTSASLQVFYSNDPDRNAPLISQVNVSFTAGNAH